LTYRKGKSQIDSDSGSDSELSDQDSQDEEEEEGQGDEEEENEEEDGGQDEEAEEGQDPQEEVEEAIISTLNVNLKILVETFNRQNQEPTLNFGLDVDFDYHPEGYTNEDPEYNFALGVKFHPMLMNIEKYMHLVQKNFGVQPNKKPKESYSYIVFDTFKELGRMIRNPMSTDDDGLWKDQLLCVPAVRRVDAHFGYKAYTEDVRTFQLVARRRGGVTMVKTLIYKLHVRHLLTWYTNI
jgi:hypothetical protein